MSTRLHILLIALFAVPLLSCGESEVQKQKRIADEAAAKAAQIAAEKKKAEQATVEAALMSIKAKLKDPSSVQVRSLVLSGVAENPIVCGELNAKNAFGGYVGFRRFKVLSPFSDPKNSWIEEADDGNEVAKSLNNYLYSCPGGVPIEYLVGGTAK